MQVSCIRICVFAKTAFYLGQGNRDLVGNLFRRRVPSFQPQLRWSSPLVTTQRSASRESMPLTKLQTGGVFGTRHIHACFL